MRDRYIYALVDPRSHEVRYVGLTVDPRARLINHYYEWIEDKSAWLEELELLGLKPQLRIIDIIPCSDEYDVDERHCAHLLEQNYIDHYSRNGLPLLNKWRYSGNYRSSTNGATP